MLTRNIINLRLNLFNIKHRLPKHVLPNLCIGNWWKSYSRVPQYEEACTIQGIKNTAKIHFVLKYHNSTVKSVQC